MKIITFLCFLFISLFSVIWVSASNSQEKEIIQYKINSITYNGELKDWVEVKISGENLKDCDYISHNNEKLDITSPKFIYSHGNYNWIVSIFCDGVNSNYEYSFPVIENTKITQEDNFYYLEINWKNFDKDFKVDLDGLKFEKIYNSQTKIYWKIIWEVKNLDLFVTSKNNDSNTVLLEFNYPFIEKIESKDNFLAGTKIYISGKNLEKFEMYVNDKKTTDFVQNQEIIEYVLDEKITDLTIRFKKYNIESNDIKIQVQWNIPYLDKYYEKSNSESSTRKELEIYGKNFPFHDEDISVYLNGKEQKISNVSKDSISIIDFEFIDWDNYLYAVVNDFQSNTLYKFVESKLPYPTSISDVSFDETQRILTISTIDFNQDTDKIYIDNAAAKILSCYSNVCRIAIDKSKLTGRITIKRWNLQHNNFVDFDYSTGQHPYIRKITFQEDPKWLTKFTIYWNNLNWSNVTGSNIFTMDDNKPEIEVTNNTIKSRLPRDYKNSSSSINVSKYSMKSTLNFWYDEISNKSVNNSPLILEIKPKNDSFLQSGDTAYIRWYWFSKSDKLFIWEKSYNLDFSDGNDYPKIVLDDNIKTGFYDFYIESNNKKISNKLKKYISESSNPEITFSIHWDLSINQEYFYNQSSSNNLFSMNISNGIEDIKLSQLEFIVQWDKNINDFWEIELYIDGKKVSHTMVKEDGKILFLEEILLEKSNKNILVELKKSWKFYAQWKFIISYLWNKTLTQKSTQQTFISKNILKWPYFTVWIKWAKNCYNFDAVNIDCEEIWKEELIIIDNNTSNQEDKSWEIIENNLEKSWEDNLEINKSKMEIKIDTLISNLYKTKTKKSTYDWLIYFKNLKIKLARVINNVPDSHKDKKMLNYLLNSVNEAYTNIFKEYVEENKNK